MPRPPDLRAGGAFLRRLLRRDRVHLHLRVLLRARAGDHGHGTGRLHHLRPHRVGGGAHRHGPRGRPHRPGGRAGRAAGRREGPPPGGYHRVAPQHDHRGDADLLAHRRGVRPRGLRGAVLSRHVLPLRDHVRHQHRGHARGRPPPQVQRHRPVHAPDPRVRGRAVAHHRGGAQGPAGARLHHRRQRKFRRSGGLRDAAGGDPEDAGVHLSVDDVVHRPAHVGAAHRHPGRRRGGRAPGGGGGGRRAGAAGAGGGGGSPPGARGHRRDVHLNGGSDTPHDEGGGAVVGDGVRVRRRSTTESGNTASHGPHRTRPLPPVSPLPGRDGRGPVRRVDRRWVGRWAAHRADGGRRRSASDPAGDGEGWQYVTYRDHGRQGGRVCFPLTQLLV
mmetsp:Transcript_10177/g.20474  ORF Transcript_10177/g.20474 Transcript_10177/m.20474 type:complete len:388 (-) Transcript_10177:37-1200(-)